MSLFISFLHPSISLLPSLPLSLCAGLQSMLWGWSHITINMYIHERMDGLLTNTALALKSDWLQTFSQSFSHVWVDRMLIKEMKNCGFYHLVCHNEHLDVTFCLNENAVVLMRHTFLIYLAMGKRAGLFSDNICCSQHVAQLRSSTFVHWWYDQWAVRRMGFATKQAIKFFQD